MWGQTCLSEQEWEIRKKSCIGGVGRSRERERETSNKADCDILFMSKGRVVGDRVA